MLRSQWRGCHFDEWNEFTQVACRSLSWSERYDSRAFINADIYNRTLRRRASPRLDSVRLLVIFVHGGSNAHSNTASVWVPSGPSNTFSLSAVDRAIVNYVQSRSSLGWTGRSGGRSRHSRDSTRHKRGRHRCLAWKYHQSSPHASRPRYWPDSRRRARLRIIPILRQHTMPRLRSASVVRPRGPHRCPLVVVSRARSTRVSATSCDP